MAAMQAGLAVQMDEDKAIAEANEALDQDRPEAALACLAPQGGSAEPLDGGHAALFAACLQRCCPPSTEGGHSLDGLLARLYPLPVIPTVNSSSPSSVVYSLAEARASVLGALRNHAALLFAFPGSARALERSGVAFAGWATARRHVASLKQAMDQALGHLSTMLEDVDSNIQARRVAAAAAAAAVDIGSEADVRSRREELEGLLRAILSVLQARECVASDAAGVLDPQCMALSRLSHLLGGGGRGASGSTESEQGAKARESVPLQVLLAQGRCLGVTCETDATTVGGIARVPDPAKETEIWKLVEESLRCPLPLGWAPPGSCGGGSYVNKLSGVEMWEHPVDSYFRSRIRTLAQAATQAPASAPTTPSRASQPSLRRRTIADAIRSFSAPHGMKDAARLVQLLLQNVLPGIAGDVAALLQIRPSRKQLWRPRDDATVEEQQVTLEDFHHLAAVRLRELVLVSQCLAWLSKGSSELHTPIALAILRCFETYLEPLMTSLVSSAEAESYCMDTLALFFQWLSAVLHYWRQLVARSEDPATAQASDRVTIVPLATSFAQFLARKWTDLCLPGLERFDWRHQTKGWMRDTRPSDSLTTLAAAVKHASTRFLSLGHVPSPSSPDVASLPSASVPTSLSCELLHQDCHDAVAASVRWLIARAAADCFPRVSLFLLSLSPSLARAKAWTLDACLLSSQLLALSRACCPPLGHTTQSQPLATPGRSASKFALQLRRRLASTPSLDQLCQSLERLARLVLFAVAVVSPAVPGPYLDRSCLLHHCHREADLAAKPVAEVPVSPIRQPSILTAITTPAKEDGTILAPSPAALDPKEASTKGFKAREEAAVQGSVTDPDTGSSGGGSGSDSHAPSTPLPPATPDARTPLSTGLRLSALKLSPVPSLASHGPGTVEAWAMCEAQLPLSSLVASLPLSSLAEELAAPPAPLSRFSLSSPAPTGSGVTTCGPGLCALDAYPWTDLIDIPLGGFSSDLVEDLLDAHLEVMVWEYPPIEPDTKGKVEHLTEALRQRKLGSPAVRVAALARTTEVVDDAGAETGGTEAEDVAPLTETQPQLHNGSAEDRDTQQESLSPDVMRTSPSRTGDIRPGGSGSNSSSGSREAEEARRAQREALLAGEVARCIWTV